MSRAPTEPGRWATGYWQLARVTKQRLTHFAFLGYRLLRCSTSCICVVVYSEKRELSPILASNQWPVCQ